MILPCPRCGEEKRLYPESFTPWAIYCEACQWCGPRADYADRYDAVSSWNDDARKIAEAKRLGLAVNLDQPPLDAGETN